MVDYREYIVMDPNKRFGKPCISGTRIAVFDVLNWLANGMTKEDIQQDFPELNEKQILACLAYAADREHKTRAAA
ncbi:MAG TPA: DUF433 domain-containing protein [Saprospiraceae bacterium]|nr:DUF433 domain-containing protein [Saprospiraceae bacterium]